METKDHRDVLAAASSRQLNSDTGWPEPAGHCSMTEPEAGKKVEQRLAKEVSEEYPLLWVGDVYAETKDSFIIEGATYSGKDDREEGMVFYAVHKESGRCGLIAPPPGPIIDREYLEEDFSWETWTVLE